MRIATRLEVVAAVPPELVVYDEPGPCSYLEGETWRLPLRLPVRALSAEEFAARLAQGDRRQGRLLYRTACPSCRACEPIRVEVNGFVPNKTQRRALRRGDALMALELGPARTSAERVDLYNVHKQLRNLGVGEGMADLDTYRAFLGETCCDTFEMRLRVDGELVGVSIIDRAGDALSAVYCYWDPEFARLSPGSYAILKQIELCQRLGLPYLYLGLYIAACRPMAYKAHFLPHQRLIDGRWHRFSDRVAQR